MPQYCAFISYSHADARFARALQRDLEKFRIPQPVVARLGRAGDRLGTVFRDVSDLGAAPKLTDALTAALGEAAALIVVCSQVAVKSAWVEQEILEYRRLHGDRAIVLPVVSPQAGDGPAEAYFPAALGDMPPLAADARKSAEGRRGALLKLVAGLLGTGLDELIRRDARRRQQRLVAGIGVTAAIALSMAVLAGFAISAREDAKRRLSQSEDLIGFMLDDLRGQLAPLGQVGVLKSVGDKALDYFESLPDGDLTESALLRKSRALYQIGEVYFELGEFAAAHESFGLSLEQARLLAAADPASTDRLFALSQAEFWVGYAAWYAGDLDRAEQHLQAYHQAAWELHGRAPDNPDWIMETCWGANNLGSLAFGRARYLEALGYFQEALARIDLLLAQEATLERRFERSAIHSWLGSTHYHLGQLEQSGAAFRQALSAELDPDNALHREERAYHHGKLAAVELHRGDLDSARAHADAAAATAAVLAESDPDSMELLYTRAAQGSQRARINLFLREPVEYAPLAAAVERLLGADRPPPKWRALALAVADLGVRLGEPGAVEGARQLLGTATAEADPAAAARQRLDLAVSLAERDPAERAQLGDLLHAVAARYRETGDFDLALPLLRGYRLLDDPAIAGLAEALATAGSRHPDFTRGDAAFNSPQEYQP